MAWYPRRTGVKRTVGCDITHDDVSQFCPPAAHNVLISLMFSLATFWHNRLKLTLYVCMFLCLYVFVPRDLTGMENSNICCLNSYTYPQRNVHGSFTTNIPQAFAKCKPILQTVFILVFKENETHSSFTEKWMYELDCIRNIHTGTNHDFIFIFIEPTPMSFFQVECMYGLGLNHLVYVRSISILAYTSFVGINHLSCFIYIKYTTGKRRGLIFRGSAHKRRKCVAVRSYVLSLNSLVAF